MTDAAWTLQQAIYDALSGISADVYDYVPASVSKPFVLIGDITGPELSSKSSDGQELTVTIEAITEGRGKKASHDLANEIIQAINSKTLLDLSPNYKNYVTTLDNTRTIVEDNGQGSAIYRKLLDYTFSIHEL